MIYFVTGRDQPNVSFTPAKVNDVASFMMFRKEICLDIEANGLDPYLTTPLLVVIGDRYDQYVIDINGISGEAKKRIAELLETQKVIGHNLKYDYKVLKAQLGWEFRDVWDTMIAEQRLVMGASKEDGVSAGLEATLKRRLKKELPQPKSTRNEFLAMDRKSLFDDRHVEYAAGDVGFLMDVVDEQKRLLEKFGQTWFVRDIEMKLVPILGDMELEGMVFDQEAWLKRLDIDHFRKLDLEQQMDAEIRKLSKDYPQVLGGRYTRKRKQCVVEQHSLFGKPVKYESENKGNINYGSSKQVLEIFNRLDIVPPQDNKGKPTLAADQVEQWLLDAPDTNPLYQFMTYFQEYQKMKKAVSSYGEDWIDNFVNPVTGKVHTEFRQCGTKTGRFACGSTSNGKPNFQQMPRSDLYRNCFGTRHGYKIVGCDLGGAELVILAANSGDQKLFELVKGDMHYYLATQCWRAIWKHRGDDDKAETFVVSKEENKDLRQLQKNVNYGLSYGATAMRIAETLGVSLEEGEIVEQTIKNELPDAFSYLDRKAEEGIRQGYIVLSERSKSRRWFPAITKANKAKTKVSRHEVSKVERLCKNAPIQGTQADMLKEAMVELDYYIRFHNVDAFMLLQIHDELQVAYREDQDWFPPEVARIMTEVANRYLTDGITMSADFDIGDRWKK